MVPSLPATPDPSLGDQIHAGENNQGIHYDFGPITIFWSQEKLEVTLGIFNYSV